MKNVLVGLTVGVALVWDIDQRRICIYPLAWNSDADFAVAAYQHLAETPDATAAAWDGQWFVIKDTNEGTFTFTETTPNSYQLFSLFPNSEPRWGRSLTVGDAQSRPWVQWMSLSPCTKVLRAWG